MIGSDIELSLHSPTLHRTGFLRWLYSPGGPGGTRTLDGRVHSDGIRVQLLIQVARGGVTQSAHCALFSRHDIVNHVSGICAQPSNPIRRRTAVANHGGGKGQARTFGFVAHPWTPVASLLAVGQASAIVGEASRCVRHARPARSCFPSQWPTFRNRNPGVGCQNKADQAQKRSSRPGSSWLTVLRAPDLQSRAVWCSPTTPSPIDCGGRTSTARLLKARLSGALFDQVISPIAQSVEPGPGDDRSIIGP